MKSRMLGKVFAKSKVFCLNACVRLKSGRIPWVLIWESRSRPHVRYLTFNSTFVRTKMTKESWMFRRREEISIWTSNESWDSHELKSRNFSFSIVCSLPQNLTRLLFAPTWSTDYRQMSNRTESQSIFVRELRDFINWQSKLHLNK